MLEIIEYKKDEYFFPALLVLGCFDAIHTGHAELLKKARLQAKVNGLDLGVMMFSRGKGGKQVFNFEERLGLLEEYNVKFVLKIDYTDEFKANSAQDFLKSLEEYINIKGYMSGKDFRFGAGAKGKSSTLKAYADDEENGVWYTPVKDITTDGEKVSTSLVKKLIEEGRIQRANMLLGREYFVCGEVVEGHGRGSGLGYPTANITYPEDKVMPARGVYGVEVETDGELFKGVANFGARPTFGEESDVLEVYLLDCNKSLYGKTVKVRFLNYIRGTRKYNDAEELSARIAQDVAEIGYPDREPEDTRHDDAPVDDEACDSPAAEDVPTQEDAQHEDAPVDDEVCDSPAAEDVPAQEDAQHEDAPADDAVCDSYAAEDVPAQEDAQHDDVPVDDAVCDSPAAEDVPMQEDAQHEDAPVDDEACDSPAAEDVPTQENAQHEDAPADDEACDSPAAEDVPAQEDAQHEDAPADDEVCVSLAAEDVPTQEDCVSSASCESADEETVPAGEADNSEQESLKDEPRENLCTVEKDEDDAESGSDE